MDNYADDLICLDETSGTSEASESQEHSASHNTNRRRENSTTRRRSNAHRTQVDYSHHHERKRRRETLSRDRHSDLRYSKERSKKLLRQEKGGCAYGRDSPVKTNTVEVDCCKGCGVNRMKMVQSAPSEQPTTEEGKTKKVADKKLEYSRVCGDDKDWPVSSGEVNKKAVRLAASIDPSAVATIGNQKKQEACSNPCATDNVDDRRRDSLKRTDKAYHAWMPDKHYDRKRALKSAESSTVFHKGAKLTVNADQKTSPRRREHGYRRSRSHEQIQRSDSQRNHTEHRRSRSHEQIRRSDSHRNHTEHRRSRSHVQIRRSDSQRYHTGPIVFYLSSQRRYGSRRSNMPVLLYSRKTYVPYFEPVCKDESAATKLDRGGGAIKTNATQKHSVKIFPKENKKLIVEDRARKSGARRYDSDYFGEEPVLHRTKKCSRSTDTDGEGLCKKTAEEGLKSDTIPSLSEKTESKVPRKLRWVLTTESCLGNSLGMNSVTQNCRDGSSKSAGPQFGQRENSLVLRKKNEIKLRIPALN